jgi:hypothetical protein
MRTQATIEEGTMTPEVILTLEKLMDYCHEKWAEADKPQASSFPTADMQTGRKMAYNDVLQYARTLLAELPPK